MARERETHCLLRITDEATSVCVATTVQAFAAMHIWHVCGNSLLALCRCQRVVHSCLDETCVLEELLQD